MRSPYSQNAFFFLDAKADATIQDIRRLQNRADILLGMGKPLESTILPFLKRIHVSREEILSGVQKLENGQSRIREELQWLHAGPKGECMPSGSSSLASLSTLLGTLAKSDGRQGAIAAHNLAVLNHALAYEFEREQEQENSASIPLRLSVWTITLDLWRSVYQREEFWDFMSERVAAWADPTAAEGDLQQARREFAEQLLVPHKQLATDYFRSGAYESARLHIQVIQSATSWIAAGNRLLAEFYNEIIRHARNLLDGALLTVNEDVLSQLTRDQKRGRLLQAEKDIIAVAVRATVGLSQLQEMKDLTDLLGDQIGECLRAISIRYFNQLDDSHNALRLTKVALGYARTESCKTQIVSDNEYLEYRILCDDSAELASQNQYEKAAKKLEQARKIAPKNEREQLEQLLVTFQKSWSELATRKEEFCDDGEALADGSLFGTLDSNSIHTHTDSTGRNRKRILVADSNEPINEVIREFLTLAGYEVRTITHRSEVITIAEEFRPDVAIVALIAPEIDGIKLSEQLHDLFPLLKIVLLGDVPDAALQYLFERNIACDTLEMPFDRQELISMAQAWTTGEDYIDPITRLRNAMHFQKGLRQALWSANVNRFQSAVIFIELYQSTSSQHLQIEDGAFLKELGLTLARFARSGSGYRCGQHKFGMLLPGMSEVELHDFSSKFRAEINLLLINHKLNAIFSLALGLVTLPCEAQSLEELINLGEKLIFTEKLNV